jgi:hypothetical protein
MSNASSVLGGVKAAPPVKGPKISHRSLGGPVDDGTPAVGANSVGTWPWWSVSSSDKLGQVPKQAPWP